MRHNGWELPVDYLNHFLIEKINSFGYTMLQRNNLFGVPSFVPTFAKTSIYTQKREHEVIFIFILIATLKGEL